MIRRALLLAVFILPVVFLLPHLNSFAYQPGSAYTDLAISHYPNAVFLQRTISEWRSVPLWSPAILSGYPFAANPLSGLFYPPGWAALFFSLPFGLNLVMALHIVWAGIGMYCFLRSEGLPAAAALPGALAFEALPKLFAHFGAGHQTLIFAVAWTPWLLLADHKTFSAGKSRYLLPGMCLGLIALADVRWAAFAGLLWLLFGLRSLLNWQRLQESGEGSRMGAWSWAVFRAWLITRLSNAVFAMLIAAPVLLPLAEYTRLSTRSLLTSGERLILSLPPTQLLGLAYPNIGGSAEWILYPGAVVFCLLLYALGMPLLRRRVGFWLVVALVSLLYALGSNIPLLELLVNLPLLNLLRVPSRALFITGFSLAVVSGFAVQSLIWKLEGREWIAKDRSGLLVFGAAAFVSMLAVAVVLTTDEVRARVQFAWGGILVLLSAAIVLLARSRRLSPAAVTVFLPVLLLVDLSGVNMLSLDFRPVSVVLSEGRAAVDYLESQNHSGPYRVYSPSYSISQQLAAQSGLELADGIDPLQLASYNSFMEAATGIPFDGYSVTLPPFPSAEPLVDNQSYTPDAQKLGLLNVRYVVSEFEIPDSRLRLLVRLGQTRIYENPMALPRAWVQAGDAQPGQGILSEPWISQRPDAIILKAGGPGLLVLSEIAYPGWQVYIDRRPGQVETAAGLFRAVRLPPGEHLVEFVYRPRLVYLGAALSATAWLALIIVVLLQRKTSSGR